MPIHLTLPPPASARVGRPHCSARTWQHNSGPSSVPRKPLRDKVSEPHPRWVPRPTKKRRTRIVWIRQIKFMFFFFWVQTSQVQRHTQLCSQWVALLMSQVSGIINRGHYLSMEHSKCMHTLQLPSDIVTAFWSKTHAAQGCRKKDPSVLAHGHCSKQHCYHL